MSKLVRQRWEGDFDRGLARRDRRACDYDAYVPDHLVNRPLKLDGDVAADVADAERAITRLNVDASTLVGTEALARILLRAEAVASSRIEGLEVGSRRLLRAEVARELGDESIDVTAAEVLGNIDAMVWAIESVTLDQEISLSHILEIHRRLLVGTRMDEHAGRIRTEQNWIGGSGYNPCAADFVPPPAKMVKGLLNDLCAFCNEDSLPAVAQAAIAHAQFETIHPFVDGNGRTGRALVHLVLRRRGLASRVLPPVSLILATWSRDYITRLDGTRYLGRPSSPEAHEGLNRRIGLFAAACTRAVRDATSFEERTAELQADWKSRLGNVRAGSTADLLVRILPGAPIITATSATALTGRSFQATNEAIDRLLEAEILTQINVGRRNRAFEAKDVVVAFTALERRLASPSGNTRTSPPARSVPRRPSN